MLANSLTKHVYIYIYLKLSLTGLSAFYKKFNSERSTKETE